MGEGVAGTVWGLPARNTTTTNRLRVEALRYFKTRWLSIGGVLLLATMTTLAIAQDNESRDSDSGVIQDQIPADALKTAEGRQLADRLRILRRSQASMGTKHPSYNGINAEIESIKERLGIRPEHYNSSLTPPGVSLNAMDEDELRQLVRRMALRIESLEKRLDALERRLEVF